MQRKLETAVQEQTKGLYTLKLYGLETSVPRGQLTVDSLSLKPNYKVWERNASERNADTISNGKVPAMLFDLRSKSFSVSGVNVVGLLFRKAIKLNALRVQEPVLRITQMREDTTRKKEPLYAALQGIGLQLQAGRILIEKGSIRLRQGREAEADLFSVQNLTLQANDLRLDSASYHHHERAYYTRSLALETGKVAYRLPDGTYRLRAGALKANTEDGTLHMSRFEVVPLLRNAQLARKMGEAATTIRMEVPELRFSGVDYPAHSRHSNLVAAHVVLQNPSLSAYQDRKNFKEKSTKALPHDLVQNLNTGFTLSKLEVKGMHIRYEELSPQAIKTGVITFENVYATATNLTNDKDRISPKRPAVVEAKARINGKAPMAVTLRMHLLDPNAHHTLHGTVGPGDPAILNSILEPTTFLSVKEGRLQKSSFAIELNRHRATGNLNVGYQDFKVDVLSKDEEKRQSLGKKILSKAANKFVIKSDNPEKGEELRAGSIAVVRAKNRSVFNY